GDFALTEEQDFLAAIDLPDSTARSAYMKMSCGNNAEFRRQGDPPLPPPFAAGESPPLRGVPPSNFPALLRQLGASLLVTTYQAGKLVLVREEGAHLNTHFRGFQAPMGMALAGD